MAAHAARQQLAGLHLGDGEILKHGTQCEQIVNIYQVAAGHNVDQTQSQPLAAAPPNAYLSPVTGSALPVPGSNSGGLKYFRGSWLCPDRGSVTWRPPVQTGPRELSYPYGRGGPVTTSLPVATPHADDRDAELNPGKNDPVEQA